MNAIPDPDQLRHQVRFRHRSLVYHRGNPVLIKVFGQLMADQAIFALHTLSANLITLKADAHGVFDDVGLALAAAGSVSLNRTQQRELLQGQTFKCAREIGRWLCQHRLNVKLNESQEYFSGLTFDDAVDLELLRVSMAEPINAEVETSTTPSATATDWQSDGATSISCIAAAFALLNARRFTEATVAALNGYKYGSSNPTSWAECQRFLELLAKAATEGLLANDIPQWTSVVLIAEAADLATVPAASLATVVQWLKEGESSEAQSPSTIK